ncbi:alpha/beta hydrolase [Streptomyces gilvifuscus]|uniref:Alpha/beta hydrolase n=1 Tax=Streptomyces gilvifuscus TaxID=1550617 RepID=A0ABT5FL97_9ACTN|nr:alpha/beta hydrolase [Streptomyces gilvifuscus]MDC2953291.1 alpha/beta hydrolase [Streptomyces gilvifuscus]
MKQMTKRLALIAAASGVVLGALTPLHASAAGRPSETLKWTKCEGSGLDPRQRCTTVSVPMDYADPRGPKIDVAVSRVPAGDPARRRGALLMIPGGPGGSGLDDPSQKGRRLPEAVRDRYDLIGIAPRGNAPSTAVDCGWEHADLGATTLRPWPAADGSVDGNMAAARRMSDACARNGGELVRHISTRNNARDIDRVRAALGEHRLSLWGESYGTYVGAAYSTMFPARTDRVVLDSNLDPDPVLAERAFLAGFETGVEDVFPEFAKWASRPGNPDRLARTAAQVRPLFLRLAARLDREPIPWPGANPQELNGNVLRQTMMGDFYDPDDWPDLAKLVLAARQGTVPPAPASPPEDVLRNVYSVAGATICNDVAWPRKASEYRKAVDASRAAYPLTAGMPRNAMLCAAWPYRPQEAPVRVTERGPANILMVQNERDMATPLSGARKLRAALGHRAVMVVNDATGHDAYLANGTACGDATVSRFLATGERPGTDVTCQ